jgi:hypothetical protein
MVARSTGNERETRCLRITNGGDDVTFVIISDMHSMSEAQLTAVQGMLDAALRSGSLTYGAEPAADGWRTLGNWTSPAEGSVSYQSATGGVADTADSDSTWEDAEWQ